MKYRDLYNYLHAKPYRYNPYFDRLEDYTYIPKYPSSATFNTYNIGRETYLEWYGTRDLQSFFSARKYLTGQMTLEDAKLKHPEFFI